MKRKKFWILWQEHKQTKGKFDDNNDNTNKLMSEIENGPYKKWRIFFAAAFVSIFFQFEMFIYSFIKRTPNWIDGPFELVLVEDSMIRFDVLFSIGFCLKMMRSLKCFIFQVWFCYLFVNVYVFFCVE